MNRHPILSPGSGARNLVLYMSALPACAVLVLVLVMPAEALGWREVLGFAVPLGAASAMLALPTWWIYGNLPVRPSGMPRWITTQLAVAALTGSLLWLISGSWSRVVESFLTGAELSSQLRGQDYRWWIAGGLLHVMAAAAHYLAQSTAVAGAAENRAQTLRSQAREARLKALQAQVDPHFLFNSLNSLSALCGFDPAGARRMAILLADFFRGSVEAGRKDWLTFGTELGLMEKYLDIEKVRFEDRLNVEIEAEDATRDCLIPAFLLQPLVENAVKHGIANLTSGGVVRLVARVRDERLEVCVANPCDPDRPAARGAAAGLANVRGRLLTLFGPEARFDVEESPENFRVELAFPARKEAS